MNPIFKALIASVAIFLSGCTSCDEDSIAVRNARELSQARLEQLYSQMEVLVNLAKEEKAALVYPNAKEGIPTEFQDLNPVGVKSFGPSITLGGCFDHFVVMYFDGIDIFEDLEKLEEPKRIRLTWGEHDNSGGEILWEQN